MEEFDFLPDLPKPNLDDRSFKDLVNECLLRIPRYCPEWTEYHPSDPGITLIELFSWLTHQMLMRFNQVPLRNYIIFLELLGIRLQPPVPAQTILTFYFTKVRPGAVKILAQTEVSTVRENKQTIVFATQKQIVVDNPIIKYFFTAKNDLEPVKTQLKDYTPKVDRSEEQITSEQWWNIGTYEDVILFEDSRPKSCFYIVLDDNNLDSSLAGNVLSITFRGEAARATGINPNNPPITWEAWDGEGWENNILKDREDDRTQGFSFDNSANRSVREGTEVLLHLPVQMPKTSLGTDRKGYWIRCVNKPTQSQPGYTNSPSIIGLSVKTIGCAVRASQCIQINRELLGVSNGKAGQTFQLRETPVLKRQRELKEYIEIKLIDERVEIWEEVENFADSTAEDSHYAIDSRTGIVQFGPLIREPYALKVKTQQREEAQTSSKTVRWEYARPDQRSLKAAGAETDLDKNILERQYGKIVPLGAEIYMVAYRTGGGSKGNVKAKTIEVLKSSIPYIKSVTNYEPARGGVDAESLTDAMLKVPQILQSRESAVTPSDFENVARKADKRVARAHCLTDPESTTPGVARLLIVPGVDRIGIDFEGEFARGMKPTEYFVLDSQLKEDVGSYLQERIPLGIKAYLEEPDYIGVKVEIEVILEPGYNDLEAKTEIRDRLLASLYRFLNPLTGGIEGLGWVLGRPVYASDIVSLCRNFTGVRDLETVNLFKVSRYNLGWYCSEIPEQAIAPGKRGLISSWDDEYETVRSGHVVNFVKYS